jgi:hypothetical protein
MILFGYFNVRSAQIDNSHRETAKLKTSKLELVITTNQREYKRDEIIIIQIMNLMGNSVWYMKDICPISCCNLYRYDNDKWENIGNPMPCTQLVPPPSGIVSNVKPAELKPKESISIQWNMKMGRKSVENGKYRFSFYYGLAEDSYTEKTICSNEFLIK